MTKSARSVQSICPKSILPFFRGDAVILKQAECNITYGIHHFSKILWATMIKVILDVYELYVAVCIIIVVFQEGVWSKNSCKICLGKHNKLIIRTAPCWRGGGWGRTCPSPLPDFLDSSKTTADIDMKLSTLSSINLSLPAKFQKKQLRFFFYEMTF